MEIPNFDQQPGVPLEIEDTDVLDMATLRQYCPMATGDVRIWRDGRWVWWNVSSQPLPLPQQERVPLIATVSSEGLDLGSGYQLFMTGDGSVIADDPPVTRAGVQQLLALPVQARQVPELVWYDVRVTNPANGASALYAMLVDTGASRSGVPMAYTRLGVEAGGQENTRTMTGHMRVKCGVVQMRLEARIFPDGLDERGNAKWRREALPDELAKLGSVEIVAKLQCDVAHLGMNSLIAWGVGVDSVHGLILPGERPT